LQEIGGVIRFCGLNEKSYLLVIVEIATSLII
jgi:hypothetical protein